VSHPDAIRIALREAARLDLEWRKADAGRDDPRCLPWMPFPAWDFIALVAEALPESSGTQFLDIGCGVGARMLVARELFELDVHGIDRVPEYVNEAWKHGLSAEVADALGWNGYGKYDLLFLNRPFKDPVLQRQLEAQVWDDMAPGAVIIGANLEAPPPQDWWLVLDDSEVRRWIMQKR
jgi:trans-aconitate methyltransferase